MTTNYMIESMDGNSLGEGFGSRKEAAKAAQAKADRLNQIVYVVRGDGHPVSPGLMAIEIQPTSMYIPTREDRNSESLDVYSLGVASVKDAIEAAYPLGLATAKTRARLPKAK